MSVEFEPTRNLDIELLRWHAAAGADVILDDYPHDRFKEISALDSNRPASHAANLEKSTSPRPGPKTRLPPASIVAAGSSDEWVLRAQDEARSAQSLEELRERLENFDGSVLKRTARSLIMATAPAPSGVLIIGDVPEADDDRSGEAFSGRAGLLLNLMLGAIGLSRDAVALTTALPWRPPGNRAPTPRELAVLSPFLARQISLTAPKLILAFGTNVGQMLAGREEPLVKQRGQWIELKFEERVVPLLTTLGPVHLLRHPTQKRYAWQDLKNFRERLNGF